MGIYDRHYYRDEPARPGRRPSPLRAVRMWSINTWLIVACVAVFVIDNFVPPAAWTPTIISDNLPAHVTLDRGTRYVIMGDPEQRPTLRPFALPVFDQETGAQVGEVVYMRMPPLKRWLHFSTTLTIMRVEFWRFIGFQFLHANLWHLLFNMLGLYFFGPLVERHLGSKRYLAFYLLCGICGALMYLLLNLSGFVVGKVLGHDLAIPGLLVNSPHTPLMGASAGVFGVLMAGAYLVPNAMVLLFFVIPMRLATLAYILVFVALWTVITGGPNAGGEAGHLGGAIAGFYFIRRPHHLHGFFDLIGRADPTSHHYRGRKARPKRAPERDEVDRILEKINAKGLKSLTEREKRILREASED
ncbi:MAG: rhomboid family intramembrane serine protease [Planctomycetota bacterium]|jgi:membrane associated rhomboid family serine protease